MLKIERRLIDSDLNDIDNNTLESKLNNLPTPKLPDPNNKDGAKTDRRQKN